MKVTPGDLHAYLENGLSSSFVDTVSARVRRWSVNGGLNVRMLLGLPEGPFEDELPHPVSYGLRASTLDENAHCRLI